jgi:hypothetical protein
VDSRTCATDDGLERGEQEGGDRMMPTTHQEWIEYFTPSHGVGASMADVEAMQLTVKTRRDQIQDMVNVCNWSFAHGDPPFYAQWRDEYTKATVYINLEPSFWSSSNQVEQGRQLLDELTVWMGRISQQTECSGVPMPPAPVPPPPDPGLGNLGNIGGNAASAASSLDEIVKTVTVGAVIVGVLWVLGPAIRNMASGAVSKGGGGG